MITHCETDQALRMREPTMTANWSADAFFALNSPRAVKPARVDCSLRTGDRLLLIGDSITEARRSSLIVETYLAVCRPDLHIDVRNLGKGGETASQFLERFDAARCDTASTVAMVCYGMNDAGYVNANHQAAERCSGALDGIVQRLKSDGARVILASPGCIGQLPPWPFVHEQHGTLDGLNTSLMMIRDFAARIAMRENIPFIDHFWSLYQARLAGIAAFGRDFAICGLDDGVHPSWAGHLIMAHSALKALGCDGDLGSMTIDLAARTASTTGSHAFVHEKNGCYAFTSTIYPFCADGPDDCDWSVRAGMRLAPFGSDLNRLILRIRHPGAARYRVEWMNQQSMLEEWRTYDAAQLAAGINLADDFHLNPFTRLVRRIEDLVFQKQGVESRITWRAWDLQGRSEEDARAASEAEIRELQRQIAQAVVPVCHHIRLTELP